MTRSRLALWCATLALTLAGPARAAEADPAALEFFEKKVRPVLVEHCYKCHSAEAKKLKGGLRLDSRAALLQGGDSGPGLVPGDPGKSRLLEAVSFKNVDLQMPPRGKLSDAAIADLTRWVQLGAPWPQEKTTTGQAAAFDLAARKREHWAWQPIRPQAPPATRDVRWPLTAADRFVLARLEDRGLAPAPPADKRTLLRRAYFDLIGLPPTSAEVEAFVNDPAADAFTRVVDRLLARPQFGERWARHWLDLVRYAETRGHEFDYNAPNAYHYRDYVIRALNDDLPYNQFVTEHLAGDLLDRPRLHPTQGFNESILATGFWFFGEEIHSPVDIRQDEADRFDNRLDVLTKTFLGLTVACARCHDHKFDAISTKDYYALAGFLQSSSYRLARFDTLEHNRRIARDLEQLRQRGRAPIQRVVAESLRPTLGRLADYLLATHTLLWADKPEQLEAVAAKRNLDPRLLAAWVKHLEGAAKDGGDLFHAWAKVSKDFDTDDPKRLAELLRPLVAADRQRTAEAAKALDGATVLVDYGQLQPADWLPDDVTFGPGPRLPGAVELGKDPARPIARVFDRAAAVKDATWDVLRVAAGAENDAGALGSAQRAGRTLRTPTFPLTTGRVFYLVKGHGFAYAAVDSHTVINGPLHGALVQSFKTGDRFQWVEHRLTAYPGHRAHLEFTALDPADFAVAMVVEAKQAPGSPELSNPLLVEMLGGTDAGSLEALARGYQRLLTDAVERLGADRIAGAPNAPALAGVADWLVRHDTLFADAEASKTVIAAARPILDEQAKLVSQIKAESRLAMAMLDGSADDEHVFIRGSPRALGELVPRRSLEALAGPAPLAVAHGSGRLELARQWTGPSQNPFVTRVLVNRVWHHLFGRGLVASVDNFGVLGERPSHPELLDWLADDFVKQGWSIKHLVRSLVLSRAYQMSSAPDEKADQADPDDLLLHRMRLRRLEGEAIRDALLSVSGRLDETMYGPAVPVYLTAFMEGRGRPGQSGPLDGAGRRSVYQAVRRNFLPPLLLAFDTPTPFSTMGRRTVSNVPAQALILLNDPFVHQQAEVWAKRLLARPQSPRERISAMYISAFARPPSDVELTRCLEFLGAKPDDATAWADLAHVLFNVKEFIYLH